MSYKQTNIGRSRAKWLPGAMAVAAATNAQAATVQISFANSFVNQSGATNLTTDIGGDGSPDIAGDFRYSVESVSTSAKAIVRLLPGSIYALGDARAQNIKFYGSFYARVAVQSAADQGSGNGSRSVTNFVAFTTNVQGLGSRDGWLQLQASANPSATTAKVEVLRFVFNVDESPLSKPDPSAIPFTEFSSIPEPSSLALLTLGAAGLFARRRRQQDA